MIASPRAPAWAIALVERVCADAGRALPARLAWRRRSSEHSTGVTHRDDGMLAVRAGTDEVDHRLTLLHELAHWLSPWPVRRRRRGATRAVHHGQAFYRVAFDLYVRYGLTPAEALAREGARYPSALRHATALGVPGADVALAGRRAALRARPRRVWRVAVGEHQIRLARDGRWTVCTVCGHRIVGPYLAWLRRRRRPARHVLWTRGPG